MDKIRERIRKIKKEQLEIKATLDRLSSQLNVKQMTCYVCTNPNSVPDMVASPCGHNGICEECSHYITTCPICRKSVNNYIKIFYV